MNKKLKTSIKTLSFMLICSVVCVGGVSTAFVATKDKIKLNQEMVKYEAVLSAAGMKLPETEKEVQELYKENVEEIKNEKGEIQYFKLNDGRYAFFCRGIGLWGPIGGILGLDSSLKTIEGIAFTYQNETPGLGGRIQESWFKEQFKGKKAPLKIAEQGSEKSEHTFDAITGATISSTAVCDMINNKIKEAQDIIE